MRDKRWYESETWDESIAQAFAKSMARETNIGQQQHMYLQGKTLCQAGATAEDIAQGRSMLRTAMDMDDCTVCTHCIHAAQALAEAHMIHGDVETAIGVFDELMTLHKKESDRHQKEGLPLYDCGIDPARFAHALLQRNAEGDVDRAARLVAAVNEDGSVVQGHPHSRYFFYLTAARVAARQDDHAQAREFAAKALDVIDDPKTILPEDQYFTGTGSTPETEEELRALVADGPKEPDEPEPEPEEP